MAAFEVYNASGIKVLDETPTGSGGQALQENAQITGDHIVDTSAHGVTGAIVGTTDTQTLTGKTISGSSNTISNLPTSAITSGTLATARLGSGTANDTTFLRGDGSWQTPSGGTVSTPQIAYVQTNGNNVTSEIGNPAKPFATPQAAYNAASILTGVIIHLGVGSFGDLFINNMNKNNVTIRGEHSGASELSTIELFNYDDETPPTIWLYLYDVKVGTIQSASVDAQAGEGENGSNSGDVHIRGSGWEIFQIDNAAEAGGDGSEGEEGSPGNEENQGGPGGQGGNGGNGGYAGSVYLWGPGRLTNVKAGGGAGGADGPGGSGGADGGMGSGETGPNGFGGDPGGDGFIQLDLVEMAEGSIETNNGYRFSRCRLIDMDVSSGQNDGGNAIAIS